MKSINFSFIQVGKYHALVFTMQCIETGARNLKHFEFSDVLRRKG